MFFKENRLKFLTVSLACAFIFVLLILSLLIADCQAIGPCDTEVGFSVLNGSFQKVLPFSESMYKITTFIGAVTFIPVVCFGATGLLQLIRRKKLFRVDGDILALGITYLLTGFFYVFFDKVVINRRPVLMAEEIFPEPSFPSSHTLLAAVICGTLILEFCFRLKSTGLKKIICILSGVWMVLSIVLRFLSGAHWFTDILGGILLGGFLVFLFGFLAGWLQTLQSKK